MLVGSADIKSLAAHAAAIDSYYQEPINLGQVHCYQVTLEMHNQAREAVLPPALHPTLPPALSLQAWQVEDSLWGAFHMVINRVSCRSGVRARGFTARVICSNAEATEALRALFGFPAVTGAIQFTHSYSGVELEVLDGTDSVLSLSATDPDPMGLTDVQYTSTLNLAYTPNGLRMVQLEADHQASKVDRLSSTLKQFDPTFWGNSLFDPYKVVSSSLCTEYVSFKPIRFVCKPDELAFTGTEPAKHD